MDPPVGFLRGKGGGSHHGWATTCIDRTASGVDKEAEPPDEGMIAMHKKPGRKPGSGTMGYPVLQKVRDDQLTL
jgi:hypothetical protein